MGPGCQLHSERLRADVEITWSAFGKKGVGEPTAVDRRAHHLENATDLCGGGPLANLRHHLTTVTCSSINHQAISHDADADAAPPTCQCRV